MWVTGAALLIRWDVLTAVGPWDESFLLYSEETEYFLRAADRGWTVWYEPAAQVEHVGGESRTNPTLAALLVVNKVKLFRSGTAGSHPPATTWRLARANPRGPLARPRDPLGSPDSAGRALRRRLTALAGPA